MYMIKKEEEKARENRKYEEYKQLKENYQMDDKKFVEGKRGFPYNLKLLRIIFPCIFGPIGLAMLAFRFKDG
jgi:hypothetical protein